MKRINIFQVLLIPFLLSACIKKEAPGAEADILTCTLPSDVLLREPVIENTKVILTIKSDVDRTALAPEFTLTPGASIYPPSGTTLNFTTAQPYLVTSEDGEWSKEYQVLVTAAGISTEFNFDNYYDVKRLLYTYNVFYDITPATKDTMDWASGNAGFALTGMGNQDPSSFPTACAENGKVNKCAKLETKSTGSFGAGVGMPIAAGNLFMGTFDVLNALTNPLKATRLGVPFQSVPTALKGFYKYKAGETYEVNGQPVSGKKDNWDVYAVFYEVSKDVPYLDGNVVANNFSDASIVSYARIAEADRKEASEWTEFYIEFLTKPGKIIDTQKLLNGGYNISIVLTSSINGNTFEGAVGSTLYIDELELIYSVED